MHLVAIVWFYIALMMALAEATSTTGTVLGAIFTFLLYGILPVTLLRYLLGTPARRRARKAAEARTETALPDMPPRSSTQPDGGGHAAGDPVAPERKEP